MSFTRLQEFTELNNIADVLDKGTLTEIGQYVVTNFKLDKQSRTEWESRQDEAIKLASQVVERKSSPWEGAANVKYPLLTEAAMQFNARAYPALIPSFDIVKAKVIGEDQSGEKMNSSIRVSRHMSYQLLEQMEEWEEEFDSLLMALPILGCMFKKTYYDPILKRNKSEIVYPRDLVVEYYTKNIREAFRVTHVIPMTKNDIKIMEINGIFSVVDLQEEKPQPDPLKQDLHGISAPAYNDATTRDCLEQHTWYDLDGDGLAEPYIFTVDLKTSKVLRIVAGFDPENIEVDGDTVLRVQKTQYFTKYGFVPNPNGSFYDLGFGQLIKPINDTVDTSINQLLDAGTMTIRQSGFLARGIRLKAGNRRFKPGEWKTVNSTGDDLRKGIVPLPTKEPSNVMFQLLGMMIQSGQRLASTIDMQVGENPGQNQKATTTMAVLDQGAKVFNAIHRRSLRSFKHELHLLFVLNSKHLDIEEFFNIIDPNLDLNVFAQIGQEDYNPANMNVSPAADGQASTQQMKLAKAQGLMELMPTGLINEVEAVRRILEAQEQPGFEALLKEPQPPQPDLELQFKMQQEQNRAQEEARRFELDIIKVQQTDLTVQTNAILALAKAESEEAGFQLDVYKVQLDLLKERSAELAEKSKGLNKEQEEDYSDLFKDTDEEVQ